MGKPTGFMDIPRQDRCYKPVSERVQHFREFLIPLADQAVGEQGARCMDCGIPFCHEGCPIHNSIPDWNDRVFQGKWAEALTLLHATNNFPEFTGRVCPAPCEAACTLNLSDEPVTIKTIECSIIDKAWEQGWISPQIPKHRTGKRVAIVGSGPCGLACAQQLARVGHAVMVFEKEDRIGGLLRYGIPDFKLGKDLIDRRMAQMQAEGVIFRPNSKVGGNIPVQKLLNEFDAIVLSGGAEYPRNLTVPGRDLQGVHFAMEFLSQQNRRVAGDKIPEATAIHAYNKRVVVIGGGDTGSDCIGTSIRQAALSVVQLEILPKPPEKEDKALNWPHWPNKLRTSSSHLEGCQREWSVSTRALEGENGWVKQIHLVRVEWQQDAQGRWSFNEIAGSEFSLPADLVLLAMGFASSVHAGLIFDLGVQLDGRGNVQTGAHNYQTSINKVFAAGDMRRGQSLVVWAIHEGRQAAREVDIFLMGHSDLPG